MTLSLESSYSSGWNLYRAGFPVLALYCPVSWGSCPKYRLLDSLLRLMKLASDEKAYNLESAFLESFTSNLNTTCTVPASGLP